MTVSGNGFKGPTHLAFRFAIPILIILALFTPVVYSRNLAFGVTEAKFFWLYFISLITVGSLLLFSRKETYFSLTDIAIASLLVYLIIFNFSLSDYNKKLFYFLFAGTVYFAVKSTIWFDRSPISKIRQLILVNTIYVIASYCCIFAQLQRFGIFESFNYSFKITSTFFHPAPFACFIASILPCSLYSFIRLYKLNHLSILYKFFLYNSLVATLFIVITIPLTNSRSAIVASVASILFIGLRPDQIKKLFRVKVKNLVGVVIIVTGILIAAFFLINIRKDSVAGRFLVWKISCNIITDNPFFGTGLDSFRVLYPNYQIEYFKNNHRAYEEKLSCEVTSAFNEILQITSETGLIGLILFFIVIYSVLKKSGTHVARMGTCREILANGSFGSLIALLIFSLFSYSLSLIELILYCFILLALIDSNRGHAGKLRVKKDVYALLLSTIFITSVSIFPRVCENIQSYHLWNVSGQLYQNRKYQKSQLLLTKLYPSLKNNDKYLTFYMRNLYDLKMYNSVISIGRLCVFPKYDDLMLLAKCHLSVNNTMEAEKKYWKAYHLLPHKFSPLYYLMHLYHQTRSYRQAKICAKMILKKEIKINSPDILEIKKEAFTIYKICSN